MAPRRRRRGTPGRSATEGYADARRVVRHRRVEVGMWSALAVVAAAVAGASPGPHRGWIAGAAVVAAGVAVVRRPRPDPDRWLRGATGEVATAELLDRLGGRRWTVLHDRRLPGSRANVDHLVIGRRGVWVVDSKAFRAPVRAGWRGVRVGDRPFEVAAVAWEATVVADRLGVAARPLIVVHGVSERGGHLPRRGRRCDGVRVLPADGLVRHLRRARCGLRLGRAGRAQLAARAAVVLPEA